MKSITHLCGAMEWIGVERIFRDEFRKALTRGALDRRSAIDFTVQWDGDTNRLPEFPEGITAWEGEIRDVPGEGSVLMAVAKFADFQPSTIIVGAHLTESGAIEEVSLTEATCNESGAFFPDGERSVYCDEKSPNEGLKLFVDSMLNSVCGVRDKSTRLRF